MKNLFVISETKQAYYADYEPKIWSGKRNPNTKTIEELVMLSVENDMVRIVWQILQQGSKFFFPSFENIGENGEHVPDFDLALSTQFLRKKIENR